MLVSGYNSPHMTDPQNTEKKEEKTEEKPDSTATPKEPQSEPEKPKQPIPPATNSETKRGAHLRQVGKKMPIGPGNFWNNMLSTMLLVKLKLLLSGAQHLKWSISMRHVHRVRQNEKLMPR